MWITDVQRARSIDRRSTEEFGLPSMVLMERAGLAVFETIQQMLPEKGRLAVFCGKGNNGGDAFVLARLALQEGFEVECLVTSPESQLKEDCRQQMLQARAQGLHPVFCDDGRWKGRLERLGQFDLIVDGILGVGASDHLQGDVLEAVLAINRSGVPIVSIDVPTGIHPDTGEELGESVWALNTVTLGSPKPCFFQGIGLEHSGRWTVKDIGYPRELLREPTNAYLMDPGWVCRLIPERLRGSHKGSNGHILIVAGSARMRGAAVLSALSAFATGAGLVTVAGIECVCQAVMASCPEATLIPLPEKDGVMSEGSAELILAEQSRFQASLFGPGLSHTPEVHEVLRKVWARWETPTVVDADALNALTAGVQLPPADCILTPHPGELSRLMQITTGEIQTDRFGSVSRAVDRWGRSVLLKGAFSIVGAHCEPLLVNQTGNPGMASAGMGDVLGGMITSLMAQDLPSYFAGGVGMYWHGLAGDICAEKISGIGYTARHLCSMIPAARAKLLESCADS
jgi:ADP-dependent NAD(P)H-hydrate dehydratase / NAD(P)H-hydrate epimerase